MRDLATVRRCGRYAGCAAVLALCVGAPWGRVAYAARGGSGLRRPALVLTPWESAEKGREVLEAMPPGSRTRTDYERVMDAYRAVYHDAPGEMHAAAAVNAVAELLAEVGRGGSVGSGAESGGVSGAGRPLSGQAVKTLKAAVGQYEFLRTQYPGSSLRVGALLAEAQIEQNDLRDPAAAREKYQELLRSYPRSSLAEEARAGLQSLEVVDRNAGPLAAGRFGAGGTMAGPGEVVGRSTLAQSARDDGAPGFVPARGLARGEGAAGDGGTGDRGAGGGGATGSGGGSSLPATAPTRTAVSVTGNAGGSGRRAAMVSGGADAGVGGSRLANGAEMPASLVERRSGAATGALAMVKGIRHWSTPNYTRVAIDLGDSVTYEAARVSNPDRIYFDLHGTRLAGELVGKSFGVTDDGYLKKIRAAQFSDDMTRVVLDVNDVTEYSAFLLPNPYRLIIDIHGGSRAGQQMATMSAPAVAAKAAPTVPNTTAVKGASPGELARVSEQPGKVEATSAPTSKPIAAVVAERQGVGSREKGVEGQGVEGQAVGSREKGVGTTPSEQQGAGDKAGLPAGGASGPLAEVRDAGGARALTTSSRRGRRVGDVKATGDPAMPARAALPTAEGETSLVRALGLKIGRIVIDAGHGGHDSGTLGVDGMEEKDVVLDVALRLGALLKERLGAEVIYTRSDDTFIPLETRTAIANKAQADLFLSIHANSSADASARGVETYYLNFTSQIDSLEVAARENAVSDQSIHQLSDLVKKIALKEKIGESREFASDVETSLYRGLQAGNGGLKDRGVKKAPFVVLIGANMPSILAEISFVTNPRDATQLRRPEYRQRVAESLYKGVAKYAGGLSGTERVATERASGELRR